MITILVNTSKGLAGEYLCEKVVLELENAQRRWQGELFQLSDAIVGQGEDDKPQPCEGHVGNDGELKWRPSFALAFGHRIQLRKKF